jgi:thiol-disulfide isomerase/thioredoxin
MRLGLCFFSGTVAAMMKRMLHGLCAGAVLLSCVGSPAAQPLKPWTGGPPAQLELQDLDGAVHRLADYRGKVVLVNFWATWCAPCRAEMPSMEQLRLALADRPFAILAVNVGESPRLARDFAERLPVRFTVLLDRDTRTTRAWKARVLPASFVVGADGSIRYSHLGDLDWASDPVRRQIEALLPGKSEGERAAVSGR